MTSDIDIQKGNVLIGKPIILGDVTFNRAVILIVDSNKEGIVGFIVNRPLEDSLSDLLPEVSKNFKVFDGGPVEKNKLYFIHNIPELIQGGLKVAQDLYWGGDYKSVVQLINEDRLDEKNIKFFLGYSGWGEMQLEDEISNEVWLKQSHLNTSEIIVCDKVSFWNTKIKTIGGDLLIWSNAPDNPNYN
jgi:putative transcriptional regulator